MTWRVSPAARSFAGFAVDWDRLCADLPGECTPLDSRTVGALIDQSGDGSELLCTQHHLIGDDIHKQQWMTRRRERWGIVAYNPRSLIGAALLAQ